MPTVLVVDGFRFFFYSNEGDEPAHIHVEKGGASAKWWLDPIAMGRNYGFKAPQIRRIRTIVHEHQAEFLKAWRERFGS